VHREGDEHEDKEQEYQHASGADATDQKTASRTS